jgi:hypothetical protein
MSQTFRHAHLKIACLSQRLGFALVALQWLHEVPFHFFAPEIFVLHKTECSCASQGMRCVDAGCSATVWPQLLLGETHAT